MATRGCSFNDCISRIKSLPTQGARRLNNDKLFQFTVLCLVVEAITLVLDQLGNYVGWGFLLAAFLLSAFVSAGVIYEYKYCTRVGKTKPPSKQKIGVVDIFLSTLQTVSALINLILRILGIKFQMPCLFPLLSAVVAVVRIVRDNETVSNGLPSTRNDHNEKPDEQGPPSASELSQASSSSNDSKGKDVHKPGAHPEAGTDSAPQTSDTTMSETPPTSGQELRRRFGHKAGKVTSQKEVFSKVLTTTDVQSRLVIPTPALPDLQIPHHKNKKVFDISMLDSEGQEWVFRCKTPRPRLTDGWLDFVRAKGLRVGDEVTIYRLEDESAQVQFQIKGRRAIKLLGQTVSEVTF